MSTTAESIANFALDNGLSVNETIVFNKTNELIKVANNTFNIELPEVEIKFDLKGRSAGQAIRYGDKYTIRYNKDLIHNKSLLNMINDTVPHELAHIVLMFTKWGKGHDNVWKRVCVKLGGNGERCHNEEVQSCRKTKKFEYKTQFGPSIIVSSTIHKRIQAGRIYSARNSGRLIQNSWKEI
jgi:predicted SprT family Zn-dependent metalloprotease